MPETEKIESVRVREALETVLEVEDALEKAETVMKAFLDMAGEFRWWIKKYNCYPDEHGLLDLKKEELAAYDNLTAEMMRAVSQSERARGAR